MPAVIICCFLVFFLIDLCWQNSLGLGQWQQMHVNQYNSTTFREVESGLSRGCGFTTRVVPEPFQHLLVVLALAPPPGSAGLRTGPESWVPDLEAIIWHLRHVRPFLRHPHGSPHLNIVWDRELVPSQCRFMSLESTIVDRSGFALA